MLQVSEDQKKIRRNPVKALPEFTKERKDDLKNRTVYIVIFTTFPFNIDRYKICEDLYCMWKYCH